ncbi:electron carrier/ protein disulfide oxidoreductase [Anaeramoeba flamelloides]|uniref:Electron carrier/ protein disulfide oxidoreductase n=1 Tax=Anaeramoeba flamelloides TaxID=1746091 RepID=A0AAV7YQ15_9EUKA|nr:electron carrier/ protein disulfide oxidoreductase [Anaeramoeba flamelloides]
MKNFKTSPNSNLKLNGHKRTKSMINAYDRRKQERRKREMEKEQQQVCQKESVSESENVKGLKLEKKKITFESLEQLFKVPRAMEYFKEFLFQQFNQENIMFFQEVKIFKHGYRSEKQMIKTARKISEKYIVPGSIFEINIISEMRKKIINNINTKTYSGSMFDEAQLAVFNHMNLNSWHAFTQSVLFQKLEKVLNEDENFTAQSIENKKMQLISREKKFRALNEEAPTPEQKKNPLAVGEELMVTLMDLLIANFSVSKKSINVKTISRSIPFQKFLDQTAELKSIKLNKLTIIERLCFFINLYNTLILHGFIINGFPTDRYSLKRFMEQSQYKVDKYYFSLNDILHGILRGNRDLKYSRHYFKHNDERAKFAIKPVDPRFHFALLNPNFDSLIKIYRIKYTDKLLNEISSIVVTNLIKIEKNKIYLPKFFQMFQKDFGGEKILLNWICMFLIKDKRFNKIKNLTIKYTKRNLTTPFIWLDLKRTLSRKFLFGSIN